jgi:hypothetical protein
MVEELPATGVNAVDMGGGAKNYYKETLKSHDILVAQGIVTDRSVLGTAHRVRTTSTRWASRTIRQHRSLHHAADQILRRTGVARRTYGRLLQAGRHYIPTFIPCPCRSPRSLFMSAAWR